MSVHEKIRFIRQLKGWSQEDMAQKLEMSVNGYGSIERGDTDVNLSRLDQIANVFGMKLFELFEMADRNIFNLAGQNNDQSHWRIGASCNDIEAQLQAMKHELDTMKAILACKDNEIMCLREINELLKRPAE